jgi:hypothetical protein
MTATTTGTVSYGDLSDETSAAAERLICCLIE